MILSRPTFIGRVVRGDGFANKDFAVPTANLDFYPRPKIRYGVYAAQVWLGNKKFQGVVCWGVGEPAKFEVHLFKYNGNLLGRKLKVTLYKRLSELIKWESTERMRQKIYADLDLARQYFGKQENR